MFDELREFLDKNYNYILCHYNKHEQNSSYRKIISKKVIYVHEIAFC